MLKRRPDKSLRPWQRLFKEVQGCRLPAFKAPQTLPCSSQAPLRPRQTFPAAPTSSWGRGSVLYGGPRLPFASLQNSPKLDKPSPAAPRRHLGRGRPFLQLQQVPEALAVSLLRRFKAAVCQPSKLPKPSPAAPTRHSGRGRPFLQLQQVPEALAVSF